MYLFLKNYFIFFYFVKKDYHANEKICLEDGFINSLYIFKKENLTEEVRDQGFIFNNFKVGWLLFF